MSYRTVQLGGGRYRLYKIYDNADLGGIQTHVRFGPHDCWIGNVYWMCQGTFQATRLDRALRVMQKLELKTQTNRYVYRLAHAIAITELGHPLAAQRHLQEWKAKHHDSNGTVQ